MKVVAVEVDVAVVAAAAAAVAAVVDAVAAAGASTWLMWRRNRRSKNKIELDNQPPAISWLLAISFNFILASSVRNRVRHSSETAFSPASGSTSAAAAANQRQCQ